MTRKSSTHTRRTLLKAAAVGTAAVGLAAAGPLTGMASASTAALEGTSSPVVAYVSDARKGEVVVMVGTREITRRDPALVARLVAIAKEARDVVAS